MYHIILFSLPSILLFCTYPVSEGGLGAGVLLLPIWLD
jgi:hypothetical protein